MKYDVMVRINERELVLIRDTRGWDCCFTYPTIDSDTFNPKEWFEIIKKETERCYIGNTLSPYTVDISAHDIYSHKEWVYLKTIDIEDGELRKDDYYEIDGKKCDFEIVYNNETDKMELKVQYVKETVDCPSYEETKNKYNEFKKLLNEYKQQERLKNELKREMRKEIEEQIQSTRSFIKRLFRMR